MNIQHYILATAGHIDHGKSALVRTLTGVDPDRLPEEKKRGITIDLGFACLELPSPGEADGLFRVGIIDVPGHEDFVKNMVAGVGSVDAALLIVAANEGWMPQTEEHFQIVHYLRVRRMVVALTKADLLETTDELNRAKDSVRKRLAGTRYEGSDIVETSIKTNQGVESLKRTLARALAEAPPAADRGKPRLPVDRVFVLQGIGVVATGVLSGGSLGKGEIVQALPSGIIARIRQIQSHGSVIQEAVPGSRTALNLSITEGDSSLLRRGETLIRTRSMTACQTLDAAVERMNRNAAAGRSSLAPVQYGLRLKLHLGTDCVPARIFFQKGEPWRDGERTMAQLRLERPACAMAGDAFVLRDWQERGTLGGGVVLEVNSSRRRFRSEAQARFLHQRAKEGGSPRGWIESRLVRDRCARIESFHEELNMPRENIDDAIQALEKEELAARAREWLLCARCWKEMLETSKEQIRRHHQRHPEKPGLSIQDLRVFLIGQLPVESLAAALIDHLLESGFVKAGQCIREAGHRPRLPESLQAAGESLRAALEQKPFDPPSIKQLLIDEDTRRAFQYLKEAGEVVELSSETAMAAWAMNRMRKLVLRRLEKEGPSTVSQLRQTLGTSRRVLIPFLEKLDREGATQREGDLRRLGK